MWHGAAKNPKTKKHALCIVGEVLAKYIAVKWIGLEKRLNRDDQQKITSLAVLHLLFQFPTTTLQTSLARPFPSFKKYSPAGSPTSRLSNVNSCTPGVNFFC